VAVLPVVTVVPEVCSVTEPVPVVICAVDEEEITEETGVLSVTDGSSLLDIPIKTPPTATAALTTQASAITAGFFNFIFFFVFT
jgi:hypothetical protein